MVLWFAEAVWMVFPLEHVLQDQSRSMWTRAVMCKGLSQTCGKQGLLTGTVRMFEDPEAGENLRNWETSQKLGYIWESSNCSNEDPSFFQDRQ